MSSITQGLKVNAQIGGELQETISNMAFPKISATFNSGTKTIKAVHTGPKQYKPDNIYFFIDIPTKKFEQITTKLLDKEKINDSSVYYQNIKKMEEMYDSIKHLNKESFLVFENVKTGSSGSDIFCGYSNQIRKLYKNYE